MGTGITIPNLGNYVNTGYITTGTAIATSNTYAINWPDQQQQYAMQSAQMQQMLGAPAKTESANLAWLDRRVSEMRVSL